MATLRKSLKLRCDPMTKETDKCTKCEREFYVPDTKKIIDGRYGIGTYSNWYPDHDICSDCVRSFTRSDLADGSEMSVIMSDAWEDDT